MRDKLKLRHIESEMKYRLVHYVENYNNYLECGDIEYALQTRGLILEISTLLASIGPLIMAQGEEVYDTRYPWLLPYNEVIYKNKIIYRSCGND